MATLQQIKTKATPVIAHIWDRLVAAQEAYHAKHGKYFQLLIEPQAKVADGADVDFNVRKPKDERHSSDVVFNAGRKLPFQLEIHEHVSKEGTGFTMIARAEIGGVEYEMSKGHGVGAASNDWRKTVEDEVVEPTRPERPRLRPRPDVTPPDSGSATSTPSTI